MKSRITVLVALPLFALAIALPAHTYGQQPAADAKAHEEHHPATETAQATPTPQPASPRPDMAGMAGMMSRMKANDAKLEELVKKMNTASGAAKTDAIAAVLTTLVEDRKNNCEPMMANMMSMMNMMGGGGSRMGGAAPTK